MEMYMVSKVLRPSQMSDFVEFLNEGEPAYVEWADRTGGIWLVGVAAESRPRRDAIRAYRPLCQEVLTHEPT